MDVSGPGMRRAVLSREESSALLKKHPADYVGQQFPRSRPHETDFAVLHIVADEADKKWRPGFYRFATDLTRIDAALRDTAEST